MSDFDRIKHMLQTAGLKFTVETPTAFETHLQQHQTEITVSGKHNACFTTFYFKQDGSLEDVEGEN